MAFNVLNRKIHYWASFAVAIPLLVMISSGLLLQAKKHWAWVQPVENRGTGTEQCWTSMAFSPPSSACRT